MAERPEQLGVAEFARHWIAAAAERHRADMAGCARQYLGAAQRRRRALTFLRRARDQGPGVILQERQRDVIGEVGHNSAPSRSSLGSARSLLRQAAVSVGCDCSGAQPKEIAACNSISSASRNSLAMISALMVLRRLPSHMAIAWSQAFS